MAKKVIKSVDTKVIGLTLDEAQKFWDDIRVVKLDGQFLVVTRDYRPMRMNVEVVENKIVKVHSFN